MEVKNGVKQRMDSNERKGECFVVPEGIHCLREVMFKGIVGMEI